MIIVLMHQTISDHDAIGNDIEAMYKILNDGNNQCVAFAINQLNTNIRYVTESTLLDIIQDTKNMIIYHHSGYWKKGEDLLDQAKCQRVIRYHNITPENFFTKYSERYENICRDGRKQTEQMIQKYPDAFWLSDSDYNKEDLVGIVQDRVAVCPPFHKIENWAEKGPDEKLLKQLLLDQRVNILFVGRIAPNKGHKFMLEIIRNYCTNYDQNICLSIIGKHDVALDSYFEELHSLIYAYGLEDNVTFVGEMNDAILTSYYLGADVFLCTSDHEGLCVPIIEAQYFELPIVAKKTTAIPETIGNYQILCEEDVRCYSAAIHNLISCESSKNCVRNAGKNNYNARFSYNTIREQFIRILQERLKIKL